LSNLKNNQVAIPEAFTDLLIPQRYKVFYGGRGGAKSHNFARALLVQGLENKLDILCTREVQKTIKQSVHKLLSDVVKQHEIFDKNYIVQEQSIKSTNGGEIAFAGLRHNSDGLKSYEGFHRVWVEEAQAVSEKSWETLIPTIRADGSEIWASFNPKLASDPVYQRFIVDPPHNALVKKVSYRDNPFFPDVLDIERLTLKEKDPEAYEHIWEGELDTRRSGAVYAKQIMKARDEKRICRVPYDPSSEVFTAWDLGFGDATSIWWLQFVGRELRWLKYYENSGKQLDHYVKAVKDQPYNYGTHFLPHDGGHGNIRGLSVTAQLKSMGLANRVLEREQNIVAGIELLRQTIDYSVFDHEGCKDGIHSLEHYAYEWDEDRNVFKNKPKHDWTSHASDAARYAAIATSFVKNAVGHKKVDMSVSVSGSYMGL